MNDADTGRGLPPQASPRPDLLSGPLLGIIDDDESHVHFGTVRLQGKWLVLHEGGADKCCSGRVVLLPARRVQSVIVARDQADLDKALGEFDIQLNQERGNGGPEVR